MEEQETQLLEDTVEWGDLCLKFSCKEEAEEVLADYTGNVDVVGVIYKPTGRVVKSEEDGVEVPEMEALKGWHVNTRGPITLDLEAYSIKVKNPLRVWA